MATSSNDAPQVDVPAQADSPPEPPPRNPLLTIFFSPRRAIRGIVATNAAYGVTSLTAVTGFTALLGFASSLSLGEVVAGILIIVAAVALALPFGIIMMWAITALTRLTGKWLGGTATYEQLKSALVWGNAPAVLGIPLVFVGCALYGNDYFTSETTLWFDAPFIILSLLGLVITLWAMVLTCMTVAEVQGFRSAWMGCLNVFLASFVLTVVGVALGMAALFAALALFPDLIHLFGV